MSKPSAPDAIAVHVPDVAQRDTAGLPVVDTTSAHARRVAALGEVNRGPVASHGRVGVDVYASATLPPHEAETFALELLAIARAARAEQLRQDEEDERARELELIARSMSRAEIEELVDLSRAAGHEENLAFFRAVGAHRALLVGPGA